MSQTHSTDGAAATPVELRNLTTSTAAAADDDDRDTVITRPQAHMMSAEHDSAVAPSAGAAGAAPPPPPVAVSTTAAAADDTPVATPLEPQIDARHATRECAPGPIAMPQPVLVRQETEAIGPSSDLPTPMLPTASAAGNSSPVIIINLLLTSTGTRHPYKIDEKYLNKRGVNAEGEGGAFDPFVISVYTLKELIWRDWREEWDPRPTSPSAIRLIHFGRLLDDKLPLRDCRFSESAPNVVHLSVKPQDAIDDEENAKAGGKSSISRERDADERTAGCRCVIL